MKSRVSLVTIIFCLAACGFMLYYIIKDFVIPTVDGTIADIPGGRMYSMTDVDDEIKDFIVKDAPRHAYSQLEDKEKVAYETLLYGFLAHANRIDIKHYKLKEEGLKKLFTAITNDYPELFWVKNNCSIYTNKDQIITDCNPEYTYSKADVKSIAKNVGQIKDMLIGPLEGKNEYEKVNYIFDYIVDYTSYDMDAYNLYIQGEDGEKISNNSGNIYGTLVSRRALCEGYAKTTQYLLSAAGIESYYVTGQSKGEGHAWNIVKIEDEYYGLDTTWCDPRGSKDEKSHGYFLCSQEILDVDHQKDVWYEVPRADGLKYNYYIYNGYELGAFDLNIVADMILKSYQEGIDPVEIHCASSDIRDSLLVAIQNQEIFNYFRNIEAFTGRKIHSLNFSSLDEINCIRISPVMD